MTDLATVLTNTVICIYIFQLSSMLFVQLYHYFRCNNKEEELVLISSVSRYDVEQVLEEVKKAHTKKQLIIITDTKIVGNNSTRRQIHDLCDTLDITSKTIKVSGASGAYMLIKQESLIVHDIFTKEDLEMFVRFTKLPIDKRLVVSEPDFLYKMNVLNNFHLKHGKPGEVSPNKFLELFKEVKLAAEMQGKTLSGFINHIENQIIEYIKIKPGYQKFSTEKIEPKKKNDKSNNLNQQMQGMNPYKVGANTFWGISIDIKSANYNTLRLYDPSIVGGTESWSDFVELFTLVEFFAYAKTFRQQVLGKLNAKRIQRKQMDTLKSIIEPLQNVGIDILAPGNGNINSDEIIISATNENVIEMYQKIRTVIDKQLNPEIWRVEIFATEPLIYKPTSGFYPFVRYTIKDIYTDLDVLGQDIIDLYFEKSWVQFCCVPKVYMTQVIKEWLGEPIIDMDLRFSDEYGNIHTFDHPIV